MDEQKFSQNLDSSLSVESVIKEFGGIRPMAAKLGIPVTTVQGWKSRGRIPLSRQKAIFDAAQRHNVDLSEIILQDLERKPVTISSSKAFQNEPELTKGFSEDTTNLPMTDPGGHVKTKNKKSAFSLEKNVKSSEKKLAEHWQRGVLALCFATVFGLSVWFFYHGNFFNQQNIQSFQPFGTTNVDDASDKKIIDSALKEPKMTNPRSGKETNYSEKKMSSEMVRAASPPKVEPNVENRELQTRELGRRVDKIQEAVAKSNVRTTQELDQLREKVVDITQNINQISKKIEQFSASVPQKSKQIALQALLLGQLENEVFAGRPFEGRLKSLRRSMTEPFPKQVFEDLAVRAKRGIPSRLTLATRFDKMVRQILRKDSNETSEAFVNTSIMERVKSELAGLFSIRRVGGAGNLHPLSMAEAAVERGDFGGAVDYLKLLSDREIDFDSRRSWIKDVRIFLKAQQHLVKLRWHVSSKLGAEAQAD